MTEIIINYILNHIFEIITALIAIYWAILSTFNFFKSRDSIQIKVHYNFLLRWLFWYKKDKKYFLVTITNIWKEINTIHSIGFLNKNKVSYIKIISNFLKSKIFLLPKEIKPTKRVELQFSKEKVKNFCLKNNFTPKYLCVWDTSWKVYKVKFNINKIK